MDNSKVIKIYNNRTKVFVGYLICIGYNYNKLSNAKIFYTSGGTFSYGSSYMTDKYAITKDLIEAERLFKYDEKTLNKKDIYDSLKEYYKETLHKIYNIKSEKDIFIKIVTILQEQRRLKIKSF